ncbi:MAG TPA: hypothetical protein VGO40_16410 [Longimicrobium sp.]|jgi:hypothetical protein|nr:hypothetical protein [Longimicrobium sp.]
MNMDQIEIEALKLPEDERARLAERLLASLGSDTAPLAEDSIFRIGRSQIEDDDLSDGSVEHDRYIY